MYLHPLRWQKMFRLWKSAAKRCIYTYLYEFRFAKRANKEKSGDGPAALRVRDAA
jgi:hypothetical protein